ncbi:hypothetical protein EGR_10826 [Echinococcus granulosus]|uniref:Uncharacterized protein n=1 Tax=Echinococcus granulosus TaxID=6210 RepID=W6TZQ6_ECHGR|nr:hypothetical protein EGR_10826 [Echinococcus granulosus]EUB54315.1 hypothetical protein EGR_10826 [Echinococcus granulosus]
MKVIIPAKYFGHNAQFHPQPTTVHHTKMWPCKVIPPVGYEDVSSIQQFLFSVLGNTLIIDPSYFLTPERLKPFLMPGNCLSLSTVIRGYLNGKMCTNIPFDDLVEVNSTTLNGVKDIKLQVWLDHGVVATIFDRSVRQCSASHFYLIKKLTKREFFTYLSLHYFLHYILLKSYHFTSRC